MAGCGLHLNKPEGAVFQFSCPPTVRTLLLLLNEDATSTSSS